MKSWFAGLACLALLIWMPAASSDGEVSREAEWLALQAGFFNAPIVGLDVAINSELPDTVGAIRPPILKADLSVARVIDACLAAIREKHPEIGDIRLSDRDTPDSVMLLHFRPGLKVFPKYIAELLHNRSFTCGHSVWFDEAEDPIAIMVYFNELVHMPSHLAVARKRVPQACLVEDASEDTSTFGLGNVIRAEQMSGAWRFVLGREVMKEPWQALDGSGNSLVIERHYFTVSAEMKVTKEGSWKWQDGRETGERLWFRD
jgi:hypothetical protein